MTTTSNVSIKHQTWIAAPIERVFELVATGQGWNRWFTSSCLLEPRPGGRFQPEWRDFGPDRRGGRDEGRVLNLDAPRHIAFEWMPVEGVRTRFTFDLRSEEPGTAVRFADHGYPVTTQTDVNNLANSAAGWGQALTLLKFCAEHGLRYRGPRDAITATAPAAPTATEPASAKKRRRRDSVT